MRPIRASASRWRPRRRCSAPSAVDVVGLGAGTLACYARPARAGPFMKSIRRSCASPATRSASPSSRAACRTGPDRGRRCAPDARSAQPPAPTDVLVVDAFSSDSVPMHLLTREAFPTYRRHLSPGGLLLVHISNRYLDLRPVIAANIRDGWQARAALLRSVARQRPNCGKQAHCGSLCPRRRQRWTVWNRPAAGRNGAPSRLGQASRSGRTIMRASCRSSNGAVDLEG